MIDVVCKKEVGESDRFKVTYKRTAYLFCSMKCMADFKREPDKYAKRELGEKKGG
jgi:YHS domain-containing protein